MALVLALVAGPRPCLSPAVSWSHLSVLSGALVAFPPSWWSPATLPPLQPWRVGSACWQCPTPLPLVTHLGEAGWQLCHLCSTCPHVALAFPTFSMSLPASRGRNALSQEGSGAGMGGGGELPGRPCGWRGLSGAPPGACLPLVPVAAGQVAMAFPSPSSLGLLWLARLVLLGHCNPS